MKKKIVTICIIVAGLISIPISFSIDSFNGSKVSSEAATLYTKYKGNFWYTEVIGGKKYFGNWGIDR